MQLGQSSRTWKLRQTGVYHSFSYSSNAHTWIFLEPREESVFQAALGQLIEKEAETAMLYRRPTVVHGLLFNSYFHNCRRFLKDKGEIFSHDVSLEDGQGCLAFTDLVSGGTPTGTKDEESQAGSEL